MFAARQGKFCERGPKLWSGRDLAQAGAGIGAGSFGDFSDLKQKSASCGGTRPAGFVVALIALNRRSKSRGCGPVRRHTLLLRDKRVCRKTRPAPCPPLPVAIPDPLHSTAVSRVGKNSADASNICRPDSAASRSIPAASHGEVRSKECF